MKHKEIYANTKSKREKGKLSIVKKIYKLFQGVGVKVVA